jgi:hypothetical protein
MQNVVIQKIYLVLLFICLRPIPLVWVDIAILYVLNLVRYRVQNMVSTTGLNNPPPPPPQPHTVCI